VKMAVPSCLTFWEPVASAWPFVETDSAPLTQCDRAISVMRPATVMSTPAPRTPAARRGIDAHRITAVDAQEHDDEEEEHDDGSA